ncbi:MAG: hypothetical protein ACPICH_06765, partial [Poseidonia sp.]
TYNDKELMMTTTAHCWWVGPRFGQPWGGHGMAVLDRPEGKHRLRHGQTHGKPLHQPWREANLYGGLVEVSGRY